MFLSEKDWLHRFLYRLTRDAAHAEDLLQETFLAVWRKRDRFRGGSASSYLRSTAYRLFLNDRERERRRDGIAAMRSLDGSSGLNGEVAVLPPDRSPERRDEQRFLSERIGEALDALPAEAREAFVLFRYEGLSCAQIAELVGAPPKTVESRLRRATEKLARRLHPYRHRAASP